MDAQIRSIWVSFGHEPAETAAGSDTPPPTTTTQGLRLRRRRRSTRRSDVSPAGNREPARVNSTQSSLGRAPRAMLLEGAAERCLACRQPCAGPGDLPGAPGQMQ